MHHFDTPSLINKVIKLNYSVAELRNTRGKTNKNRTFVNNVSKFIPHYGSNTYQSEYMHTL